MFAWQINTIEQINKMNPELKRILSTNNWGFLLIRTFYAVVKYLVGAGCVRRCESNEENEWRERIKRANEESEWRERIKKANKERAYLLLKIASDKTYIRIRSQRMIHRHQHPKMAISHIFKLICPIRASWLLRSAYHSFHNIYRTFDLKLVSLCYLKQEQCMLLLRKNGCFGVGIIHAFT